MHWPLKESENAMISNNANVNYKDIVCEGKDFSFDGQHFVLQDFFEEPYFDETLNQYILEAVVKCVETGSVGNLKLYFSESCELIDCSGINQKTL